MKKHFLSLSILFLVIFSIGCNKLNIPSENYKSIKIGVMPDMDSIPFIIAQQNGYFEEEGIDVTIEHFKSAIDRDTALQTNTIDGAISDMLSVVFFNDGGFNIKITSKTEGSFKLISGKDSIINKLEDINDNSIGISKNTIIDYLTDRILENSKIDTNKVEKIAIPKIPTRLEMLQNGLLDMATLPEPLASLASISGGKILSSSDMMGINPGVMIFSEKAIQDKPKEIKAIYRAYNKAVNYLNNEDLDTYINIIIAEAGFPESIKDVLVLPNYSEATMPMEEELIDVLKWLKSKQLTESNYTIKELSDSSFIE